MNAALRSILREQPWWLRIQALRREGWRNAATRLRHQRRILPTAPVFTACEGDREIHILTWDRDWQNALWALKSFYRFSGVSYPLHIHDGGLRPEQARKLLQHFPQARIWGRAESDQVVEAELLRRGFHRCLAYRQRNVASRKLFDFFLLGTSPTLISLDSDVIFFRRPSELLATYERNLFNRDLAYAYSMSLEEIQEAFNVALPPLVNSGLSLTARHTMNFSLMEQWLQNEKLFADRWVTEQTLQAMCSALHGIGFLPETYAVGTEPGFPEDVICKHYPGFFRPLLYSEGMKKFVTEQGLSGASAQAES